LRFQTNIFEKSLQKTITEHENGYKEGYIHEEIIEVHLSFIVGDSGYLS
jgi:hypothetical protein